MTTPTSILIRVQARGGKFLGPDIGYSFITVRDVASGVVLAQSSATGDSGQLGATLAAGVSTGVVMTAPLTPNWLSATMWIWPGAQLTTEPGLVLEGNVRRISAHRRGDATRNVERRRERARVDAHR